jgi:hypothetical protein
MNQWPYLNLYIKVPKYIAAWVAANYTSASTKVKHCLGLAVANLLAHGTVAYTRRRPHYSTPYSAAIDMLRAIERLVADGYATSTTGYKNAGYATGVPSTLAPTPKLLVALPQVDGVEVDLTALPILTVDKKPIYKKRQVPPTLPPATFTTMLKLNREYFNRMVLDPRQLAPGTECLSVVSLTRDYKTSGGAYGVGRLHQKGGASYQQLSEEQRAGLFLTARQ